MIKKDLDLEIDCLLSCEICLRSVFVNGLITKRVWENGLGILKQKIKKLEALKKL